MKVKEEHTPSTKGIENALPKIDFQDTFSTTNHQDDLPKIAHLIFGGVPKWVEYLMRLRNFIVQFFGLKTEMPADYNEDFKVGGYVGFFQIYTIEDNEIILGANDKHLDFRVSIYDSKEDKFNIKATTLVKYNNAFGKLYMTVIKPFHRVIVKRVIQQAYNV